MIFLSLSIDFQVTIILFIKFYRHFLTFCTCTCLFWFHHPPRAAIAPIFDWHTPHPSPGLVPSLLYHPPTPSPTWGDLHPYPHTCASPPWDPHPISCQSPLTFLST